MEPVYNTNCHNLELLLHRELKNGYKKNVEQKISKWNRLQTKHVSNVGVNWTRIYGEELFSPRPLYIWTTKLIHLKLKKNLLSQNLDPYFIFHSTRPPTEVAKGSPVDRDLYSYFQIS